MKLPEKFHEGAVFERADGALLRIDMVSDEQVYFVSWRPGHEWGSMIRMTHDEFLAAWAHDWTEDKT